MGVIEGVTATPPLFEASMSYSLMLSSSTPLFSRVGAGPRRGRGAQGARRAGGVRGVAKLNEVIGARCAQDNRFTSLTRDWAT